MPKYDKFIVKADEGNLTFFTKMIANEIAEANRLKRIELELKIHELNMAALYPNNPEDDNTVLDDREADDFKNRLGDQA